VISAFYTCAFWKLFGKYFSALFPLFFRLFLCEASGRCFWLSRRACKCDLLHVTTSGCHLSSVRTVNPLGLKCFPPAPPNFLFHFFFLSFLCHLIHFSLLFMCASHVHLSFLQFISTPGMVLYPFTVSFSIYTKIMIVFRVCLILSLCGLTCDFYAHILCCWVEILSLSKLWYLIMVFMLL